MQYEYVFLVRRHLSGAMGGQVLVVTLDLPSTLKFGHVFPPGTAILSSGLPSTSKFGYNFRPESVGEVFDDGGV